MERNIGEICTVIFGQLRSGFHGPGTNIRWIAGSYGLSLLPGHTASVCVKTAPFFVSVITTMRNGAGSLR